MNLNKVILIGRLTQDPETRSTPSGQTVATLRMATNRVWTNQGGQKQEAVEFHTIVAWGRLAEIAGQYMKKGGLAMIEGRLQTRSWVGQDNVKRYNTEIVAENLQMGPRSAGAGSYVGGNVMSDIKKPAPASSAPEPIQDADIPIIDANEPISQGVDEGEIKIREEDLPF